MLLRISLTKEPKKNILANFFSLDAVVLERKKTECSKHQN
jgi:hypothetical protein